MEKSNNTTKSQKDMSIGELFAEKTVSVLRDVNKKSEQRNRKAGLQKIGRRIKEGLKIRWTCGVCRAYIDDFDGSEGIHKLREYLKKLDKQGCLPCPANGKKHLNRLEIERDAIILTTTLMFNEEKPPKAKKAK